MNNETDLHAAIMNLPADPKVLAQMEGSPKGFYLLGHRDARHAAAETVLARASAATQAAGVLPPVALPALTDEQIEVLWNNVALNGVRTRGNETPALTESVRAFARAILAASAAPAPEQIEPTDAMVAVFHDAISGGDTQCDFQNEIKRGLRAVLNMQKAQPNAGAEQDHLAGNRNEAPCGDEAVERDAARYRWLSSIDHDGIGAFEIQADGTPVTHGILIGGHLDAAIDAALSAVPPTVKEE